MSDAPSSRRRVSIALAVVAVTALIGAVFWWTLANQPPVVNTLSASPDAPETKSIGWTTDGHLRILGWADEGNSVLLIGPSPPLGQPFAITKFHLVSGDRDTATVRIPATRSIKPDRNGKRTNYRVTYDTHAAPPIRLVTIYEPEEPPEQGDGFIRRPQVVVFCPIDGFDDLESISDDDWTIMDLRTSPAEPSEEKPGEQSPINVVPPFRVASSRGAHHVWPDRRAFDGGPSSEAKPQEPTEVTPFLEGVAASTGWDVTTVEEGARVPFYFASSPDGLIWAVQPNYVSNDGVYRQPFSVFDDNGEFAFDQPALTFGAYRVPAFDDLDEAAARGAARKLAHADDAEKVAAGAVRLYPPLPPLPLHRVSPFQQPTVVTNAGLRLTLHAVPIGGGGNSMSKTNWDQGLTLSLYADQLVEDVTQQPSREPVWTFDLPDGRPLKFRNDIWADAVAYRQQFILNYETRREGTLTAAASAETRQQRLMVIRVFKDASQPSGFDVRVRDYPLGRFLRVGTYRLKNDGEMRVTQSPNGRFLMLGSRSDPNGAVDTYDVIDTDAMFE